MGQVTVKKLKPKLSQFKKAGKYRPICGQALVESDGLYMSDLECWLHVKDTFGLGEGFQDIDTLGLLDSVQDNVQEFPVFPSLNNVKDSVHVDYKELEDLNNYASDDETRLHLNGVCFDDLNIVATNGHILKCSPLYKELEQSYIIPKTGVELLVKLCKLYKIVNDVQLSFNENYVVVNTVNFDLTIRLIKREFPNWKRIVPETYKHTMFMTEFPKLKDIKPLLDGRSMGVKLLCEGGMVKLVCPKHDKEINVKGTCTLEDFEIGFNARYLDIASQGHKEFEIKFNSELAPCEVNGAIVMPLKL